MHRHSLYFSPNKKEREVERLIAQEKDGAEFPIKSTRNVLSLILAPGEYAKSTKVENKTTEG